MHQRRALAKDQLTFSPKETILTDNKPPSTPPPHYRLDISNQIVEAVIMPWLLIVDETRIASTHNSTQFDERLLALASFVKRLTFIVRSHSIFAIPFDASFIVSTILYALSNAQCLWWLSVRPATPFRLLSVFVRLNFSLQFFFFWRSSHVSVVIAWHVNVPVNSRSGRYQILRKMLPGCKLLGIKCSDFSVFGRCCYANFIHIAPSNSKPKRMISIVFTLLLQLCC